MSTEMPDDTELECAWTEGDLLHLRDAGDNQVSFGAECSEDENVIIVDHDKIPQIVIWLTSAYAAIQARKDEEDEENEHDR